MLLALCFRLFLPSQIQPSWKHKIHSKDKSSQKIAPKKSFERNQTIKPGLIFDYYGIVRESTADQLKRPRPSCIKYLKVRDCFFIHSLRPSDGFSGRLCQTTLLNAVYWGRAGGEEVAAPSLVPRGREPGNRNEVGRKTRRTSREKPSEGRERLQKISLMLRCIMQRAEGRLSFYRQSPKFTTENFKWYSLFEGKRFGKDGNPRIPLFPLQPKWPEKSCTTCQKRRSPHVDWGVFPRFSMIPDACILEV